MTATDLVLTVTQMLRKKGVVGKFVEFYGPGLDDLPLEDRATIANMAPEYGATCGFFPIDAETLAYLEATGRKRSRIALVETYAKAQGLWRDADTPDPVFTDTLALDLGRSGAVPGRAEAPAGPRAARARRCRLRRGARQGIWQGRRAGRRVPVKDKNFDLGHGDVVIAAITSCTNTSNPYVMIGAGLLARKAVAKGLKVKPWVKTSLAPGSQVVTDYLAKAGLQDDLDKLGFNLVGYGCTTCIGNSGPLPEAISEAITRRRSCGRRGALGQPQFRGPRQSEVRANYLASPPLVVAYALAGSIIIDLATDPLGTDNDGEPVYLKDIWPRPRRSPRWCARR